MLLNFVYQRSLRLICMCLHVLLFVAVFFFSFLFNCLACLVNKDEYNSVSRTVYTV